MNDQDHDQSIQSQAHSSEEAVLPGTGAVHPSASGRRLTMAQLLGVLAGGERSSQGERDIVASAMAQALKIVTPNELPSLSAVLDGHRDELDRCARRCVGSDLTLDGLLQEAPFLALCAEIHRHGFVDADGKEGRTKLFLALADLVAHSPGLFTSSSHRSVASGLRVLIERLAASPKAGVTTRHFSVWQLFEWIADHGDLADYVKRGVRSLQRSLVIAWSATVQRVSDPSGDDDDEEAATPELANPNEIIWSVPDSTRYVCELPAGLKKKLLANELTRITALSRYAFASLLNFSDAEMRREVSRLTDDLNRDASVAPFALAQLLSIATGTPVEDVYRIRWRDTANPDPAPAYPGVLSEDAGWLIRSEFNPREDSQERFQPRAVHQPIPEPLAALLRAQAGIRNGMPVIVIPAVAKLPPAPRAASAWLTAYASRLMRDGRFGISVAQHLLHTSLGLDKAPIFYDRIPADHLAHAAAKATHPWFGCPPRPRAQGMPTHFVGSQRVVDKAESKAFLKDLHTGWSSTLPLYVRIHHRSRNLRYGILLGIAHRTNESIAGITRSSVTLGAHIITVSDKAVALDHASRLAAIGHKLSCEIDELLAELSLAIREYPDTELARAAKRILAGTQSLFLRVESANTCGPIDLADHMRDSPPWSEGIQNWARHLANDELSLRVPEPLRVAQLGWHGTRAGAISELSVLSPVDACARLSTAVDEILKSCGWAPLPRSGITPAVEQVPPVNWTLADREHRLAFDKGLARLYESAANDRDGLAAAVLPGVNAFFRANDIRLQATADGLIPLGTTARIPMGRDMHERLLRVMVADARSSVLARELLHAWLKAARHAKVISGPLPRQVVRTYPRQPGAFIEPAHRSLDHRDGVLQAALGSDLTQAARTFITVLLEGWVADAGVVLHLLQPGAKLHDLADGNFLLIEASQSRYERNTQPAIGCLAFNDAAALALRAWHRGGKAAMPDSDSLRKEIHDAIAHALSPDVSVGAIFEELEALMRANLSLRCPGIVRDVVLRRVTPSFAPITRVVDLHEDHPIFPAAPSALSAASIAAGVRKSRARRARHGYNQVKDILTQLVGYWTPGNDDETRSEAVAALRLLVPDGAPSTGVHVVALYAAAYLTEGLQKSRVRPITVQDAVYSVGHALSEALPEQADLSRREVWQATYARALEACPAKDRHRLANDLTHFQKVMAREFDLPVVGLSTLLIALDVPSPPEPVGFLTRSEQSAVVCFGRLRLEAEMAEGSPLGHEVALRELAVTTCALSTSLRDREVRVPQVKAWRHWEGDAPFVALHSNGQDFVKSEAGRRSLHPTGPFSPLFIETINRLVGLKQSRTELRPREKLFIDSDYSIGRASALRPTCRVNADLRYVTRCPEAALDVTRKTWALRTFNGIGNNHVSLWPIRDFLSEMGQAGIATTLGHYLHDPVTFLKRMPKNSRKYRESAGWILGMVPKAAQRLLNQERSWLRPPADWQQPMSASVVMLPVFESHAFFEPNLTDASALLALVANGQSIESASHALAWPTTAADQVASVLAVLRDRGVVLGSSDAGGMYSLSAPSRRHGHEALIRCAADAHCWRALAWIFETWLADWRARDLKGFTGRPADWERTVPQSSPLRRLPWRPKAKGHMTFFELTGARAHEHSAWPELRWMALSAWFLGRLLDREVST